MLLERFFGRLRADTEALKTQGFFKPERVLTSSQSVLVSIEDLQQGKPLINMCANNYLGLANDSALIEAARSALMTDGFGMASVRFICGSHQIHKKLERRLSTYLRTDDTILFGSCFDANTGVFEALLDEQDVVISDELNHASIIDGIRLSKASRLRYRNNDMIDLERALQQSARARTVLVVTDGVFSMDGVIADLKNICLLAEQYGALVMVDDSHAVGFVGPQGRGTPSLCEVDHKVHLRSGTLGKALGGASGGYVSGRQEVIDWLRQRARPYLFSNSLMPAICAASLVAIDLAEKGDELRENLELRTAQLRSGLEKRGYALGGTTHPIVPVLCGEARTAVKLAEQLLNRGILVVPFAYPVVPKGNARVRMQVSAAHTEQDISDVIHAFDHS